MNFGSTVILGANNSYSGGTDVQNGTLKLAKDPTSGAGRCWARARSQLRAAQR